MNKILIYLWSVCLLISNSSSASTEIKTDLNDLGALQVIVKFKKGVSKSRKEGILKGKFLTVDHLEDHNWGKGKKAGLAIFDRYSIVKLDSIASREELWRALKNHSDIEAVEFDQAVSALDTLPNDPDFGKLWGLQNTGQTGGKPGADIKAIQAWDQSTGDQSVIVAVIDTGVDYNHVDLRGNIFVSPNEIPDNGKDDDLNGFVDDIHGYDAANNDTDPMDDHYHGTHCAGTIAAKGNNSSGVTGVNWNVRIMPVKFLTSSGSGSLSAAIKAIQYATNNGAQILSNSWGGGAFSQALQDVITAAYNAGISFIAAAGNSNSSAPMYPAAYEHVISVAATDHNDVKASFSNFGTTIDVAAPGVNIYSTVPGNAYKILSGTSMATPHVAGMVALMKAKNSKLTPDQIEQILDTQSDDLGAVGRDDYFGHGRINANKALSAVALDPDLRPIAHITSPESSSAPASGVINVIGTASGTDFTGYSLEYAGTGAAAWTVITNSNSPVENASLGTLDTANLVDGKVTIRLIVTNASGLKSSVAVKLGIDNITAQLQPITNPPISPVLIPIIGSANVNVGKFVSYKIEYGIGKTPTTWFTDRVTLTQGGNTPIANDVLGFFDQGGLLTGNYSLRLTVISEVGLESIQISIYLDHSAPSCSISKPYDSSINYGNVTISAIGSDNVLIDHMDFLVDGTVFISKTSPYTVTWNSTTVADGSHVLSCRSYDKAGNFGNSSPVNIKVQQADTTPPKISFSTSNLIGVVYDTLTFYTYVTEDRVLSTINYYLDGIYFGTSGTYTTFAIDTKLYTDGIHFLMAEAVDAAGNKGSATVSINILNNDTTPPSVNLTNPSEGSILYQNFNFAASASDNVAILKVEFYVDGLVKFIDSTNPFSGNFDSRLLSDGPHSIMARAYDLDGNTTDSQSVNVIVYNFDTTPPQMPNLISPAGGSRVGLTTVYLDWSDVTDSSGVRYLVQVDNDADFSSPIVNANVATSSINGGSLPYGFYYWRVQAFDNPGNTLGWTAPARFEVYDAAGPTCSITSPLSGSILTGSALIKITSTDVSGVASVGIYLNNNLIQTSTQSPYEFVIDTTKFPNGNMSVKGQCKDSYSNAVYSTTKTYTFKNDDLIPPAIPNLTSPINDTQTNFSSISLDWTDVSDLNGVNYTVQVDNDNDFSSPLINLSVTSSSYTASGIKPAEYFWRVQATDGAGNVSGWTTPWKFKVLDIALPYCSITSPIQNAAVSGTIVVRGSASDNVGVTEVNLYLNDQLVLNQAANIFSYTWDTQKNVGPVKLHCDAKDAAGNYFKSAYRAVTVKDNTAPLISIESPVNGSDVSQVVQVQANASDNSQVYYVQFYVNGILQAWDSVPPYQFTWDTSYLFPGSYQLSAQAVDYAGNSSSLVVSLVNILDTLAPASPTLFSPTSGAVVTNQKPYFEWSLVSDISSVNYQIQVDQDQNFNSPEIDLQNIQTTNVISPIVLPYQLYWWKARAIDGAGNASSWTLSSSFSLVDQDGPTTSFSNPTDQQMVTGQVSVLANVTDPSGVSKVDFYVNDKLVNSDTSATFGFGWNSRPFKGSAVYLKAVATDKLGNVSSTIILVNVY